MKKLIGFLSLLIVLTSCDPTRGRQVQSTLAPNGNKPDNPPIFPQISGYGGSFLPQPSHNIATKYGVELGKKLFFDPALSANGKVSCATCHSPSLAFSDNTALSPKGITQNPLARNSPALFNLAWSDGAGYFWDGGVNDLESLPLGPLTHPDEMGTNMLLVAQYLKSRPDYVNLFNYAFDTPDITSQKILYAMAQYMRTLVSLNSKFDKFRAGEVELTTSELAGFNVYQTHCATCHSEPWFSNFRYENIGLDESFDFVGEDPRLGRSRITLLEEDKGKYKVPSLRNLAYTAPYMHDGRFATLDEVLEHYNTRMLISPTLSPVFFQYNDIPNQSAPARGMNIPATDLQHLKAFLNTLNDETFVSP